jgi:phosphotransferase system enzyme I (PtsI)
MQAREFRGRTASDGIYAGPLVAVAAPQAGGRKAGSEADECSALTEAIGAAVADIAALMEASEGEAADILGFQIAMLEDDALRDPALAAIAGGDAADTAWAMALDVEIAGYLSSDDDYFRARAADLKDIRDRVMRHLLGVASASAASGAVLWGDDLAPTRFLEADWTRGGAIALTGGSSTSHVAMLARARGVPMVVGLGACDLAAHHEAIVDGEAGIVIADPGTAERERLAAGHAELATRRDRERRYLLEPARLKDGTPIQVLINVAGVDELDHLDPRCCDGIGLMRSEFLFRDGAPLPDENQQYQAYRRFVAWAEGRSVTIRTLDIGGDKPIAGLTAQGETNPFLGLRGVRLTLARPEVFRTQLRALARAAVHGPLKIMIPMVTVPDELDQSTELLHACVAELRAEGVACAMPPLGIMVEVPAAAIAIDLFRKSAFFSIGSNDLTQYVTATSRDATAVAALGDPGHPAMLRLIEAVSAFGQDHGIPVSLCGDMASETSHLNALVAAGLRSLSVAPSRVARVKAALAEL